jgi:hypothetical protein
MVTTTVPVRGAGWSVPVACDAVFCGGGGAAVVPVDTEFVVVGLTSPTTELSVVLIAGPPTVADSPELRAELSSFAVELAADCARWSAAPKLGSSDRAFSK